MHLHSIIVNVFVNLRGKKGKKIILLISQLLEKLDFLFMTIDCFCFFLFLKFFLCQISYWNLKTFPFFFYYRDIYMKDIYYCLEYVLHAFFIDCICHLIYLWGIRAYRHFNIYVFNPQNIFMVIFFPVVLCLDYIFPALKPERYIFLQILKFFNYLFVLDLKF